MKVLSEQDLMLIREGSTEPLSTIFSTHYKFCVNAITLKTDCSKEDAKDFVMDAVLVLRDKIMEDVYVNTNVQSYLITVAINKWKNKRRKDAKHLTFDPSIVEQYLNQKSSVSELSEVNQKMVAAILISIDRIGGNCQKLLNRHLKEGIPLSMLVDELGYKSKDVIKTTKSRCIKKLKEIISDLIE